MSSEYSYVDQDWIIEQFQNLKFRVSFATKGTFEIDELNDMGWIKRKIEDASGGIVLSRKDLIMANTLWKRYSDVGMTKDTMWDYIDYCCMRQRKIQAIKTYRQFTNCGLREAKDTIDERLRTIKQNLGSSYYAS